MLDVQTLRDTFKGDLITAEHPEYAKAIARWAANAERPAGVVAFVKNSADVVSALNFARANGLEIAVRGGGHSPGGASSTAGGLVVDLSRYMNKVTVDAENKLAYVDGGALWETVDKEAIAHGLATVAGTVNDTGVGGLTLGGGYGWLSGELGLSIDNLVKATVVTSSGSILTASADENPDLFWAIRGGGGNFGVVTQFVFKLSPQRRTVYAGEAIFPISRMDEIVERVNTWWKTVQTHEGLFVGFTTDPQGTPIIYTVLFYNGSEPEGRANFEWLLNMEPLVDTTKEIGYEQVGSLMNHLFPHGKGTSFHSLTLRSIHLPSIKAVFDGLIQLKAEGRIQEPAVLYQLVHPGAIHSVPSDKTAFRRRNGIDYHVMDVLFSLRWDQSSGDQTAYARSTILELEKILSEGEAGMTGQEKLGYLNHDGENSAVDGLVQVSARKAVLAYGANYTRLQQVKRNYDPENVFNKWLPITPAS